MDTLIDPSIPSASHFLELLASVAKPSILPR